MKAIERKEIEHYLDKLRGITEPALMGFFEGGVEKGGEIIESLIEDRESQLYKSFCEVSYEFEPEKTYEILFDGSIEWDYNWEFDSQEEYEAAYKEFEMDLKEINNTLRELDSYDVKMGIVENLNGDFYYLRIVVCRERGD